jgi:hypothetical protein
MVSFRSNVIKCAHHIGNYCHVWDWTEWMKFVRIQSSNAIPLIHKLFHNLEVNKVIEPRNVTL